MLSRRNVRIKIMQLLFTAKKDKALTVSDLLKKYMQYGDQLHCLYFANLYYLIKVLEFANKDNETRKKKHLLSQEDKDFTNRIYDNPLIQSIISSSEYKQLFSKFEHKVQIQEEDIRIFYNEFSKTEEYIRFATLQDKPTDTVIKDLLSKAYKTLYSSEQFNELMEDINIIWYDDDALVIGLIKKLIKNLPSHTFLIAKLDSDDMETYTFGEQLLVKSRANEAKYSEMIQPFLVRWELDRIATIDLIVLQLSLCEFMEFPSIPTKVTINEYVDIAKNYSTDKSRDFINGILDKMMKKLLQEKLIQKEGRGLVD
jgi:transcription antitermination protein NusB